ncbi:cell division control protein 6 homolog [Haliotis cracherodii]|uniref:cell division control protein 6 homolog n=1 Tax=Haliotis cracherodii TaxID=6455 RepID=UPI0039E83187
MASQVQRRLDMNFPVRKNTRLRSKSAALQNENEQDSDLVLSPRKRSGRAVPDEKVPMSCSPTKKKKELVRVTRSRRRETPVKSSLISKFGKDTEKEQHIDDVCVSVKPILCSPTKRQELSSPTRNQSIPSVKPIFQSPSKGDKCVKVSLFSPLKSTDFDKLCLTSPKFYRKPDSENVEPVLHSPKKHVRFAKSPFSSPVKEINGRLPLSPSKLFSQNNASPVKVKKSPIRPTDSPSKRQLFAPSDSLLSSPSKMLRREGLSSPVKARRFGLLESPSKFRSCKENSPVKQLRSPVKQQRTPVKKSLAMLKLQKVDSPAYHIAKQSLHTAKPEKLDCRDREVGVITEFLERHLQAMSAGSLYISGAPGTGKTASLLHIIDDLKNQHACKIAYLNCMMLKDSTAVFRKLHEELTGRKMPGNRDTMKYMEKCVTSAKQSIIMVLDEIDQLDSKHQEVLYTIFEWPSLTQSKLILVGIANALDLTDRILPRLQARPKCRPQLLNFAPYSKEQIASIIKGRLRKMEEDGLAVIEPSAIQFCARKVSAVAGDMRKALDVCRRAVEMVEHEIRSQPLLAAGSKSPRKSQPPVPKKITVMHISRIMSDVYGSSVKSAGQEETVPLQQKLVVCTLLVMLREGKFKEVAMGKLHETYCRVCTKRHVAKVDQSEFFSLCLLLESRGILGVKKAKESRLAKVTLKLDEKELEHTLQDRVLMSSILQEGIPK